MYKTITTSCAALAALLISTTSFADHSVFQGVWNVQGTAATADHGVENCAGEIEMTPDKHYWTVKGKVKCDYRKKFYEYRLIMDGEKLMAGDEVVGHITANEISFHLEGKDGFSWKVQMNAITEDKLIYNEVYKYLDDWSDFDADFTRKQ